MSDTVANKAKLTALRALSNQEMDSQNDSQIKDMLKELRTTGLIVLHDDEIDALTRKQADALLAEARHNAQVMVQS